MVERYMGSASLRPKHSDVKSQVGRASIKKETLRKAARDEKATPVKARDSFQNFALNLGQGTNNALSQSNYGFNPITRIRTLLEFIHRGSWIGGTAINLLADDMTRGGIELITVTDPTHVEKLQQGMTRLKIWTSLRDNVAWSNLYGGSIAVVLIDGQNPDTPLRIETVGKEQFKGLMVLDRWQVDPDLQNLVDEYGPHLGEPKFYRVVSDAPAMRGQRIHYTRCIRLEGIRLPYWQRIMENLWGLSVFEPLYDRMVAFDSATTGAAQLVYKAFLRTYKIDGLHDAATVGGDALVGISRRVEMMRKYQGIEGITLLDSKDDFTATSTTGFTGIADVLVHFAEQLSGSLQIPLVRLLGQSPAGLNSTGESDLRTYYDNILQRQERDLREGVNMVLRVLSQSLGIKLPDNFNFNFNPLWQLNEDEKSQVSDRDVKSVLEVEAAGLISEQVALTEIRQLSRVTGRFTNITDEMIAQANDVAEPPQPEMGPGGAPVDENGQPVQPELDENGQPIAPEEATGAFSAPGGKAVPGEEEGPHETNAGEMVQGLKNLKKATAAIGDGRTADGLPFSDVGGLQVVIETAKGSPRRGRWGVTIMPCDYGYIRRVPSAEGKEEWLDVLVGPAHSSKDVWVVDALNPHTGEFDEHKIVAGFTNSQAALECFRQAYHDRAEQRVGAVTHMNTGSRQWRDWLATGDMTKPLAFRKAAA